MDKYACGGLCPAHQSLDFSPRFPILFEIIEINNENKIANLVAC